MENAFLPCNRNGVLFPRKISGKYAMLSRPERPRPHPLRRHLLQRKPRPDLLGPSSLRDGPRRSGWQMHQDRRRPRAHRDHRGLAADLPRRADHLQRLRLQRRAPRCWTSTSRGRSSTARGPYLLAPQKLYECVGDVPNVVFPCAALADAAHRPDRHLLRLRRHRHRTVFRQVDELIDFIRNNSEV